MVLKAVIGKLKRPDNWIATTIIIAVVSVVGILAYVTGIVQDIRNKIGR